MSPEDRYRNASEDQLELFEPPRRRHFIIRWMPGIIVAICILMLWLPAFAEEPKKLWIRSGTICNTLEQVQELLASIDRQGIQTKTVDGCGQLTVRPDIIQAYGGLETNITLVKAVDNPFATNIVIAEFDFTVTPFGANLGKQYGWISYQPRPKGVSL